MSAKGGSGMSTPPLVLVADDEPRITRLVTVTLSQEGFRVVAVDSGEAALAVDEELRPDIVVLGLSMPDLDGIEVMRLLRERRQIPIILLSTRRAPPPTRRGASISGRTTISPSPSSRTSSPRASGRSSAGRWTSRARRTCWASTTSRSTSGDGWSRRRGELVHLSRTEWLLLSHLAANAGRVVLHGELLTKVWGPEYRGDLGYLRVWVSRVRRKLGTPPGQAGRIRTFQGIGYLLDAG